jgi:hypothetical protein
VRGGYELTADGRALEAAVLALERWGWDSLGEPAEGEIVTADSLSFTLRAAFQPEVTRSMPPTEYRLHVVAHVEVPVPSAAGGRGGDTTAVSVSAVVADGVLELRAIGAGAIAQPARALPQPTEVLDVVVSKAELHEFLANQPSVRARVHQGGDALLERFHASFHLP